jgi:hypothetical protein
MISRALRIAAVVCFALAALGIVVPVNLTALGLALWCGSTLL